MEETTIACPRLRPASGLVTQWVCPGAHIAWNRYCPSITVIDEDLVDLLEDLATDPEGDGGARLPAETGRRLLSHALVTDGERGSDRTAFVESLDRFVEQHRSGSERFLRARKPYRSLLLASGRGGMSHIFNAVSTSRECPRTTSPICVPEPARRRVVTAVVDRFLAGLDSAGQSGLLSFSGGEPLADCGLVRHLVSHVRSRSTEVELQVSSDATLVEPQLAEFLARNDVQVVVSVDGRYVTSGDGRRKNGGMVDFAGVLSGVELLNSSYERWAPGRVIRGVQGSLDSAMQLSQAELARMQELGVGWARMAPDLLQADAADGRARGFLHVDLFMFERKAGFEVGDVFFTRAERAVGAQWPGFAPFCQGLANLSAREPGLVLFTDDLSVSACCAMSDCRAVPYRVHRTDIHHPALLETSSRFLLRRIEAMKAYCVDCDVVGLCQGGCVLNGLGADNRVNAAACEYQRAAWSRIFHHLFRQCGAVPGVAAAEAGQGCTQTV